MHFLKLWAKKKKYTIVLSFTILKYCPDSDYEYADNIILKANLLIFSPVKFEFFC